VQPPARQGQVLYEALAAAQAIKWEAARADALAPQWAAWAASNRPAAYDLWTETLRALSTRPLPHLLANLRALAPVLAALGGAQAIEETFHAIQDVGRWWP